LAAILPSIRAESYPRGALAQSQGALIESRAKSEALPSIQAFPADLPSVEFGSKALIHILGDRVGRGSGFEGG
jgi:hypothetical protein